MSRPITPRREPSKENVAGPLKTPIMVDKDQADRESAAANGIAAASSPTPPSVPRFEIATPNKGFRGKRFGVEFAFGKGQTSDPAIAERMKVMGYTVVDRQASLTTGKGA